MPSIKEKHYLCIELIAILTLNPLKTMMDVIQNWYEGLEPLLRVYWIIAIAVSVVFAIQMLLTVIGIGDTDFDTSMDADADFSDMAAHDGTLDTGGALQLFTVRNMVNFLLGLGWGGVCFWNVVPNPVLLVIVSLLCGLAFVSMFLWMFRRVMRLESNGAFRLADCVNQSCSVYLRIPAARKGMGKVQVSFGGSVQEIQAVTDGDQIPSGTLVKVVALIDQQTLLVQPV